MIKIYVMATCPDCTSAKALAQNDPRFEIIDIGDHVRNLKEFLRLRDHNPAFEEVRKNGYVGIPCFVKEDGSITFSPEEVGLSSQKQPDAPSCSIDGKGC